MATSARLPSVARVTDAAPVLARRSIWLILLTAILCGGAVRLYLAWTASVIARDGVEYVAMARRMAVDWRAEVPHLYPLGYPFLVRWIHAAGGGLLGGDSVLAWQRSGQMVSVAFGTACVPLVYWLGRRLFDARCGLLAAWIWALLPQAARLSADALTDMPHLAMILFGLAAAMGGLRRRAGWLLVAAGLLSGAAYTLRTEGGELAVVAALMALGRRRASLRWRAGAALAVVGGFLAIGGSYAMLEGGRLFSKQDWVILLSDHVPVAGDPQRAGMLAAAGLSGAGAAAGEMLSKLTDSLNTVWLVMATLYAFIPAVRRLRRRDLPLPLALWALHAAVLFWLFHRRGYISSRHVMLLDVGLVILAAAAVRNLAGWMSRRHRAPAWTDGVIAAVLLAVLAPRLLRDINHDRAYIHEAARWVAGQCRDREPVLVAQDGWVPFYAGARRWAVCPTLGDLAGTYALDRADFLILEPDDIPPREMNIDVARVRVRLTERHRACEPEGGRGFVIYAVEQLGPM